MQPQHELEPQEHEQPQCQRDSYLTAPVRDSAAAQVQLCSPLGGPPLVPPLSFACVTGGVYRGGFPKQLFEPFLNHLELRTLVSITPEPLPAETRTRLSTSRPELQFVHIAGAAEQKKSKKKRDVPVTIEHVVDVLRILTDPERQPVYVHCMNGRQVTSLIVACLRVDEGWSIRSTFSEYAHFCDYDRKDVQFVEEYAMRHNRPLCTA